ncbi:MAG: DNA cytosine methyltransferase, partial [Chloroflexota bacterium]
MSNLASRAMGLSTEFVEKLGSDYLQADWPRTGHRFSVLDLFCGAGGFSFGFALEGFMTTLAFDNDESAVATFVANLGPYAHVQDLSDGDILHETPSIIVGGPPCQGFSSAGLRQHGDHRNTLVASFARIVARLQPEAFVFENVEGFLTSDGGERVFDLITPLVQAGYRIHMRKINAANYGVPQHRKRVVAIGGLGWDPSFPQPTHRAFGAPGAHRTAQRLPAALTLDHALADLPTASTEEPGVPRDHFYRPLQGIDMERAHALM